jgi:enamine deaminase RidA (YjgF/YER057c/UK114 family)
MSTIIKKLKEMGYELPVCPKPVASYVPALQAGEFVFTSGQLPLKDGKLQFAGEVGGVYATIEDGQEAARLCTLNALSAIESIIGDLDRIKKVVKLTGYVKSAQLFNDQPRVINGASDFILELFGPEIGSHTRAAIGVKELPLNASVELELIVQVI